MTMARLAQNRYLALIAIALIMSVVGCGRRVSISEEQPVLQERGAYEIFWVEPQIVVTDSLITLIRSDRIDSAKADPSELIAHRPAAIDLSIHQPACYVSIGMYDSNLRLLRPLLVRDLTAGYYRLTLQFDRFRDPSLPPGRYFLKADYCGKTEMSMFSNQ